MTLDIDMPEMDGLETLAAIRKSWPRLPVIMFSTLTERGALTTLDALALGAHAFVEVVPGLRSFPEGVGRDAQGGDERSEQGEVQRAEPAVRPRLRLVGLLLFLQPPLGGLFRLILGPLPSLLGAAELIRLRLFP